MTRGSRAERRESDRRIEIVLRKLRDERRRRRHDKILTRRQPLPRAEPRTERRDVGFRGRTPTSMTLAARDGAPAERRATRKSYVRRAERRAARREERQTR